MNGVVIASQLIPSTVLSAAEEGMFSFAVLFPSLFSHSGLFPFDAVLHVCLDLVQLAVGVHTKGVEFASSAGAQVASALAVKLASIKPPSYRPATGLLSFVVPPPSSPPLLVATPPQPPVLQPETGRLAGIIARIPTPEYEPMTVQPNRGHMTIERKSVPTLFACSVFARVPRCCLFIFCSPASLLRVHFLLQDRSGPRACPPTGPRPHESFGILRALDG